MNLPDDIALQAIDALGITPIMANLEDGTEQARVLLRAYAQCRKQLLRAVHWDFCRKQAPLTLLADASGNTPNVGNQVIVPWGYEYALPTDCLKVRFVPWNGLLNPGAPAGNIVPPNPQAPLMTGLQSPATGMRLRPARFLVATDFNYPPPPGQITWEVSGLSPQGRTVICANVQQAQAVYSADMLYPSVWDPQFRAAMVSYLASEVALPLWVQKGDRKFGLACRKEQIELTKQKVMAARITDGNEGHYSSDIKVDWLQARNSGSSGGWGYGQSGGSWCGEFGGFDSLAFADGSAF